MALVTVRNQRPVPLVMNDQRVVPANYGVLTQVDDSLQPQKQYLLDGYLTRIVLSGIPSLPVESRTPVTVRAPATSTPNLVLVSLGDGSPYGQWIDLGLVLPPPVGEGLAPILDGAGTLTSLPYVPDGYLTAGFDTDGALQQLTYLPGGSTTATFNQQGALTALTVA